ncbi:MAG: DUF1549 domain-containing protein, partial [Planctomycetia bacterium]
MAAPNRLLTPSLFLLSTATWLAAAVGTAAEPGGHSWRFDRDIRPLLAENCYACHGPGQQEAGLRLDSAEAATRELDSGARAIVAGDLATSELVTRIDATDPATVMPPPHSTKTLTAEQKNLLKTWIAAGAPYERHWSHRPIERPAVPARGGADRGSPIDVFLAERLSAEGLPVNAEADRPTLIRRLSFALTGLPPTPEQVAAFVADGAADAYEKLVASMLASPHHRGVRPAIGQPHRLAVAGGRDTLRRIDVARGRHRLVACLVV